MELAILLSLIFMNGAFAMSEMALVSSRKTRLIQWADDGRPGARAALQLANEPSHFLSTIQIGITAIGILSGIYGEAALARPLAGWLSGFPLIAPFATGASMALVVVSVTALSLVFGELVPKRLALMNPEAISSVVATPMGLLARAVYPLVRLLSFVTEAIVRMLGARKSVEPPVTEEEIHVLMEQGRMAGVFDPHEQSIVRRAFALDEQRVVALMTPRRDLQVLRQQDSLETLGRVVREHSHSRLPIVDDVGNVVGLLHIRRVTDALLANAPVDIARLMEPALFVPRSLTAMELLESFKKARQQAAFVVDEYGHSLGMVTLNDVLTALVGEIGEVEHDEDPDIVRREDGSWLMSGSLSIADFKEATAAREDLPDEGDGQYHTLGGLSMAALRTIPRVGDRFETKEFVLEVVDMDQHRVDKLLVYRKPDPQPE